jgi:hypothetical protein
MAAAGMTYGSYTFDPVPLISVSRERVRDSSQNRLYDKVTINCAGWLVDLGGDFGSLDVDYYQPLVSGLDVDCQELTITHESGVFIEGVYPRVEGFQAEESVWVDTKRYSFQFVYEEQLGGAHQFLQAASGVLSYSDNWSWQEQDNDTTALVHTVQAQGLNTACVALESVPVASNALANAQSFVSARLGTSNIPAGYPEKIYDLYVNKSYIRRLSTETADVAAGSYSVTENFILASGLANSYIHRNTFQYSVDSKGIGSLQVNGNIQGDGERAPDKDAYASSGWDIEEPLLFGAASGVHRELGATRFLNRNPISQSVTRNKSKGSIDYNYTYSDKLNADEEDIVDANWSIARQNPIAVFATIGIPGKLDGAVWQDIQTVADGTYTISGDVIGTTIAAATAYAQELVNAYGGQTIGTRRRITGHTFNKTPQDNSVNFSITWTFQNDAATSLLL